MQFNLFFSPEPCQSATMCPSQSVLKSGRRTTPPARGSDHQLLNLSNYFILNYPCFKYKVVTDNCEHAFWEECEDQTKKVPFHVSEEKKSLGSLASTSYFPPQTMESQCWKAKEIWYEKCREVSKPINMMCWSCVVKTSP